ncbi:MAG: threonyl-tRNA synthetase editing domain-containing protein [Myxococcota bacterium]
MVDAQCHRDVIGIAASNAMKLLTFQARRFAWQSFSKTLEDAPEVDVDASVTDAVVVFLHAEVEDEPEAADQRVFKHSLKHLKWLANKRGLRTVVLHSFAHLGGSNASAAYAQSFIERLAIRLRDTGYDVACTPFGYFCSWQIDVYGDSLAKVFKQIDPPPTG